MPAPSLTSGQQVRLEHHHLQDLFESLKQQDYQLVGPTVKEEAIVYDSLDTADDLPVGWTDEQDGGRYRLQKRKDEALFGYVVGPHSWKKFLFPQELRLWEAKRNDAGFEIIDDNKPIPKYAFIGVRACELHAMLIQDRVFIKNNYADPVYQARRENAFIVSVNCTQAGGTCFCVSMKTGPKADTGFDLALTEVLEGDRHYFIVEVGSENGVQILSKVPYQTAKKEELTTAHDREKQAARQMGRSLETMDIKELLYRNYNHERWQDVANRCLSCANCTMVCPTCFCSTVEDVTDLSGAHAERVRRWDSCFTMDFSYIHGGSMRPSTQSRYRQWMTHKLATWFDQFGTSGCVGCGRCITWCPVGIDITEEVRAIRESEETNDGG